MKGVARGLMKEKIVNKLKGITAKQKIISVVLIVVLVVGSAGGYAIYQSLNGRTAVATLDMASLYQDEIVQLGDIVVGISESGTASLVYEQIDLDSGYEVTEIYAATGVYFEEGEVLATLDLDASDLEDTDALEELEEAEDALTQKTIEVEAQLIQAESTYNKAVAAGESAATIYDLTIDEINDGLTDIDDEIEELEDNIADLEYQVTNGLTDDFGLEDAQDELESIAASITSKEAEIAKTTDAMALETLNSELEKLEEEYTQQEAMVTSLTSQYDTAYDALSDQIENYEDQLASKETERTRYVANMPGDKVDAKSVYDTAMNTYSNAYTEYSLTVASLNAELEEAQELVDTLTEALEEEDEEDEAIIIDEDGNLLAPCSGYITSVSEPSSITIENNTIESGLSITMSDGDYAQIDISISQDDIADIYIGMVANVVFDSYEDVTIISEVDTLSLTPSGDMASSVNYTVTVVCDIPQDEGMTIFSSMTATVTFVEAQTNDVMVISSNYVGYEDGVQYVYVEQADGSVVKTDIVTGFSDGFDVEVISGVEVGDIIVNESAVSSIEN